MNKPASPRCSKLFWLFFLSFALSLTACTPFTWTSRLQQPLFEAPPSTTIALVSVEINQRAQRFAPAEFRKIPSHLFQALQRAFRNSRFVLRDRRRLGYRIHLSPQRTKKVKALGLSNTVKIKPSQQPYHASPPTGLPSSLKAPLILGVRVLTWASWEQVSGKSVRRKTPLARVDIAYSLWTRQGKLVEQQRIRVTLRPMQYQTQDVVFLPSHDLWSGWTSSTRYRKSAPSSPKHLMRAAIETNAGAFAWPFVPQKIHVSAVWDDSHDRVKYGVELAKNKKFQQAYESWKEAIEGDPNLSAALFNLAMVCEVLGKEKEALAYYKQALQHKSPNLYKQRYKLLRRRLAQRRKLPIPDDTSASTRPAQPTP